ncbi:alpha/beta hydrolase family protein [Lentzea atacamensis]|uniref:Alpha/beta hydrolase family protein n=1 Tax=Lentzea atacamensis TaxID=531938 RepID=A0A316HLC0_9PSEU|nr:alpha/beta fold hydrolase [Lentzea atacamensis]PWK80853.1 alpha/beta hydrolase family protein [Lentzea atacamensis]
MTGLSTVVKGTGPALLLVHGAGGSVQANYGPILGTLTQYFTVIAPDLPGSGGSPKAGGPLDLEKLADDLVDLAVGAGHESFFVCGCSMGCAVAVTGGGAAPRPGARAGAEHAVPEDRRRDQGEDRPVEVVAGRVS